MKRIDNIMVIKGKRLYVIQLAVLFAAITMIYFGANSEELDIVFRKAVYICMECIGLG